MARRSAGLVAALAAVALTLFAGGCGAITELVRLQQRVEDAGYSVDGIFHDDFSGGASEVQIDASSGDDGQPPPDTGTPTLELRHRNSDTGRVRTSRA